MRFLDILLRQGCGQLGTLILGDGWLSLLFTGSFTVSLRIYFAPTHKL